MTNEILLIQGNTTIDISNLVEDHTWYGSKGAAPRSLELHMVYTDRGGHSKVESADGQGILFRENGKELFRGTISRHIYSRGKKTLIVHDRLLYTAKNRDTYLFVGKTADQIAKKVFSDFGIPIGNIVSTGYVIPYLLFDGDTIYDIVMKALQITYENTGQRFAMFSEGDNVHIVRKKDQLKQWVVEDGVNLVEYTYETSIEDTVTKVKLIAEFDKKTITAVAEDKSLQSQFGTMQHFEKAGEKTTQGELNAKAKAILQERGKVKKSLMLTNIPGISEVVTGVAIYVLISELNVARPYYVDEDTHVFRGRNHTMTLKLTETDELPEITAGTTERPKPKPKPKPKKKKEPKKTAGEKK
ncbi:hypothetical protein [Sporosarcina sp. Marseille-Q4943]|uniref:XkdQ/YqbQ family protein n=1 Tax=Sporosarcina sp. Marseille-Q4943 TaxID=2942204 RepID=UPI00208DB0C4|nr:hypothetical protein [Sporosarcina sp. Marseille-Q4943]